MSPVPETGYERLTPELARRVDAVCDRFEQAWRRGEHPAPDAYLDELSPPERLVLLRELVVVDVLYRRQAGESPRAAEYLARFPALDVAWLAAVCPEQSTVVGTTPVPPAATPRSVAVPGYEILGKLGQGGMGVVYQARQTALDRLVALKMIRAGAHADPEAVARFQTEAQAVARLNHPNVVQIYEVGEHDDCPYLALEFVPGGSLDRHLAVGPMGPRQAAELLEVLARAVHHAHQRGIVHRDLKPSNILLQKKPGARSQESEARKEPDCSPSDSWLLTPDSCPKITDFGLAKCLEARLGPLTATEAILGTPSYMAPEQIEGRRGDVGPPADVYALGAVLYECLTGRPPFEGETPLAILQQVQDQEPVPVTRLRPEVTRDLETVCLKCLRKEAARRYGSAEALADDLRRFLAGEPVQARPVGGAERLWRWCRRKPVVAGLTAAVALLLLAFAVSAPVAVFVFRQQRDEARQAEQQALDRLWDSRLEQARAARLGKQPGHRATALRALAEAAALRPAPELRDETIACLALADLRIDRQWEGEPDRGDRLGLDTESRTPTVWRTWGEPDRGNRLDFDAALGHYAWSLATGDVSVRRVADDSEVRRLWRPPGCGQVMLVAFSPDGRFLALNYSTGSTQRRFFVRDLHDDKTVLELQADWLDRGRPFSPDSRRVAVSLPGEAVGVYELPSGRAVTRLEQVPRADELAFDPAGRRLALTSPTRQVVEVRDLETGKVVASLRHPASPGGLTWHRGGRLLAAGYGDGQIHVWDLDSGWTRAVLRGHAARVASVAFSQAGDLLVSSSEDGTSRLWDPFTGDHFVTMPGAAVRFSADDSRLAFRNGALVGLCDVTRSSVTRLLHPDLVSEPGRSHLWRSTLDIDFDPGGRLLSSAGGYGVLLWDLATAQEVAHLRAGPSNAALFDPRDGSLITCGQARVRRWLTAAAGAGRVRIGPPQQLSGGGFNPFASANQACLSRDGRLLAINQPMQKQVVLINVAPPFHQRPFQTEPEPSSVALSRDGRWLAAGSLGTRIRVWDQASGQVAEAAPAVERAEVAFSPDGCWLVTATAAEYRLWEVGSWQPGLQLGRDRGNQEPGLVAFAPDGRLLAVTPSSRQVRLIETATGRTLADLSAAETRVLRTLRFSPDGTRLVAATNSAALLLWDLRRVRHELAALGLDWDHPPYPPAPAAEAISAPLQVEVQAE